MKIYSAIGAVILSAFSVQAMAGGLSSDTVTVRGLSAEVEVGDFPVCFNGAGKLVPCASGVEPPPVDDPYIGNWSGRMIYDRGYIGDDVCDDADVSFHIIALGYTSSDLIDSITVKRDGGGMSIYLPEVVAFQARIQLPPSGSITEYMVIFGERVNFTLQFTRNGYVDGQWAETSGNCYGTWSLTRD